MEVWVTSTLLGQATKAESAEGMHDKATYVMHEIYEGDKAPPTEKEGQSSLPPAPRRPQRELPAPRPAPRKAPPSGHGCVAQLHGRRSVLLEAQHGDALLHEAQEDAAQQITDPGPGVVLRVTLERRLEAGDHEVPPARLAAPRVPGEVRAKFHSVQGLVQNAIKQNPDVVFVRTRKTQGTAARE